MLNRFIFFLLILNFFLIESIQSQNTKKATKFYLEGNSYTANFIPMFNSLRIDDYIYYEHTVNPFLRTEFKKINNLKNFYNEVIYTTNINTIEDSGEK